MPHIPRRFSATRGVRPELTTTPRKPAQTRPPVPYRGSSEGEEPFELGHNPRMSESVSMRRWQMPVDRVYKVLFGKEAKVDEHTRQLVLEGTR